MSSTNQPKPVKSAVKAKKGKAKKSLLDQAQEVPSPPNSDDEFCAPVHTTLPTPEEEEAEAQVLAQLEQAMADSGTDDEKVEEVVEIIREEAVEEEATGDVTCQICNKHRGTFERIVYLACGHGFHKNCCQDYFTKCEWDCAVCRRPIFLEDRPVGGGAKGAKAPRTAPAVKKAPNAYNIFMKEEIARMKADELETYPKHSDRFNAAAKKWTAMKTN